jgi:hypothetical protein
LEVWNSSQFTRYIVYAGADFVESHEKWTYTLSYPNHILSFDPLHALFQIQQKYFPEVWNTMIISPLSHYWIIYTGIFHIQSQVLGPNSIALRSIGTSFLGYHSVFQSIISIHKCFRFYISWSILFNRLSICPWQTYT